MWRKGLQQSRLCWSSLLAARPSLHPGLLRWKHCFPSSQHLQELCLLGVVELLAAGTGGFLSLAAVEEQILANTGAESP